MHEEILTGGSGREYRFVEIDRKHAPQKSCLFLIQDTRSNSSDTRKYVAYARHGKKWIEFYERNGLTEFNRIFLCDLDTEDMTIPFNDLLSGGHPQVLGHKMPDGIDSCP
ncbi:hypothetical protein [Komagataeibacter europaeus]|uniref:hypothetical protein n=1 Tax=Komagataeibacter europaeus TaxID=33995 RepID=UPI000237E094|nr:hypothetical protein [Komagataeibacter europaeus]